MSARWDDAATTGWRSRNASTGWPSRGPLWWLERRSAERRGEQEADGEEWRWQHVILQDGWPQPVALLSCAIVSFAIPVSWALFATEAEAKEGKAVNSTGDGPTPQTTNNPWEQLGTIRTVVIFVACGTWLTCLWLHVARLSLAEQRRRQQMRETGRSDFPSREPQKISKGLLAILDTPLPASEPRGDGSSYCDASDVDEKDVRQNIQGCDTVVFGSSSSEYEEELRELDGERRGAREQDFLSQELDTVESLSAEIACLQELKQQQEMELAMQQRRRLNRAMRRQCQDIECPQMEQCEIRIDIHGLNNGQEDSDETGRAQADLALNAGSSVRTVEPLSTLMARNQDVAVEAGVEELEVTKQMTTLLALIDTMNGGERLHRQSSDSSG